MQSLAQKKARENFKKAIEYRKKTGCSLKEAFAHVSAKKTVIKKKATLKKVAGGSDYYTRKKEGRVIPRKSAKKSAKKKAVKKPSEQSILNKIHKVKHDVERLDEAQHKHMSIGNIKNELIDKLKNINNEIAMYDLRIDIFKRKMVSYNKEEKIIAKQLISEFKKIISELKTHSRELKKHI